MTSLCGVGGAFVFSNDPLRLAEWYQTHFGFAFEAMGDTRYQMFVYRDLDDPTRKVDFHFGIMKAKPPLPERTPPSPEPTDAGDMYGDQPFMLNIRVRSLDDALNHLAKHDVLPIRRDDEEYGKFAWVRDVDGNRVELYEPNPGSLYEA